MSDLKEAFTGGGAGVVFLDAMFNSADLLFAFADVAYVPLSVAFGTLAPNVEWLSQDALQPVVVFVAMLYIANVAIQRIQRFRSGDSDE
ncbi:hypothetical protein [Halorubrum salinum]|uniref:hypothetical protein n=1 Tax=Halorubrum salinum TaxID=767517 RepID=UPI0021117CB1|nr:hypothetical protein [Halorubrum salinum]